MKLGRVADVALVIASLVFVGDPRSTTLKRGLRNGGRLLAQGNVSTTHKS